jgi:phosphate transport system substrate-binding protein
MMNRRQLLKVFGITAAVGVGAAVAGYIAYPSFAIKAQKDLMISGSKAVSRFVALLIAPFIEKNPGAKVSIEGGGSFAGLTALANGGIDVAMMSRDLNFEEFNLDFHSHLIGIEGIAIVVHSDLAVKTVSLQQLNEIFEGLITNWSEVGGPNKKIVLYNRAAGSTTRAFIEDLVMRGAPYAKNSQVCNSAADVTNAVSNDPYGIGYLTTRNLNDKLKTLAINGVEISDKNLLLKLYPLARDMFLVNRNSASQTAKDFIRYSLSAHAQDIFVKNGLTQVSR